MRELTFAGFTSQYVAMLSNSGSTAIYPLAREACDCNPRLRAPLFLYAAANGRTSTLMTAVRGTELYGEYELLRKAFDSGDAVRNALETGSRLMSDDYQKVWSAYQSRLKKAERDARVKSLIRECILALQTETGISTYRISKELGVNNANMNAWLKNGDPNKVSLDVARRALNYLEETKAL